MIHGLLRPDNDAQLWRCALLADGAADDGNAVIAPCRDVKAHRSGHASIGMRASSGLAREKRVALEILTAIKRAGADIIITYWARELAEWTRN